MTELDFQKANPAEVLAAQNRVALTDPDHLLRWLQKTNRTFLVLSNQDLVESLKHLTDDHGQPVGLHTLQQLINCYLQHRQTLPSGETRTEKVRAPDGTASEVQVALMKDDTLTTVELDRAIRQLTREMFDRNPNWSLNDDPL